MKITAEEEKVIVRLFWVGVSINELAYGYSANAEIIEEVIREAMKKP